MVRSVLILNGVPISNGKKRWPPIWLDLEWSGPFKTSTKKLWLVQTILYIKNVQNSLATFLFGGHFIPILNLIKNGINWLEIRTSKCLVLGWHSVFWFQFSSPLCKRHLKTGQVQIKIFLECPSSLPYLKNIVWVIKTFRGSEYRAHYSYLKCRFQNNGVLIVKMFFLLPIKYYFSYQFCFPSTCCLYWMIIIFQFNGFIGCYRNPW